MCVYLVGTLGFLCFFIYDWNSISIKNRVLQKGFLAGCILNLLAAALLVRGSWIHVEKVSFLRIVWLFLMLISLVLLIYTLFFAVPFEETYIEDNKMRQAYTERMYALCRHPGVLWYALFFLCLSAFLSSEKALLQGGFLTAWNVLYIVYQDRIVFPATFTNYQDYKRTTPFLFPTGKSIRHCMNTFKKGEHQDESE